MSYTVEPSFHDKKNGDTKLSACVWQCEKQQTEFDTKYGITTKCKRKQESRALRPGGSPAAELGGIHPFVLGCWKSWRSVVLTNYSNR